MQMKNRRLKVLFALLLCLSWHSVAEGRVAVKAAFNSLNANSLPAWIARDKALFAKHGLDVSLVYIGGPLVVPALAAREIDFSFMGGTTGIQGALAGLKLTFVATTVNKSVYSLAARPGLKSFQDLKRRNIGVSRLGGATHMLLRYAFQKAGFDAEGSPKIVQLFGSQSDLLTGLLQGRADAVVLAPPATSRAKTLGMSLIGFEALVSEYLAIGLVARADVVADRAETVEAFLKAYVEAVHFVKTRREDSIRVLGKNTGLTDYGVLEESYNLYRDVIPARPFTTRTSVQVALDMVQQKALPERFFNNNFIEKLDRGGFIDSLYK